MIKILCIFQLLFFYGISAETAVQATDTQNEEKASSVVEKDPKTYIQETKGSNLIDGIYTGNIGTITPTVKVKSKKVFGADNEIDIKDYAKVTLLDVILETVSQNYNIKIAREKVRQAKLTLDDAYAGYKPTVDMEYKFGNTKVSPGDAGADKGKNRYQDETLKILIKQNLYAGGATQNKIDGLKKSLEVAKNRYELAISKEIQNAINAYFGVVFSYQSLYATRINMEMLQKILEIVTTKYDLGAASLGDISSIKASVSNAQSKLSKTNSKFVEAIKYYEYVAGEDFKYTLPYEYEFTLELQPLEEVLKIANERNLNVVSYLLTLETEKYKLKSAESAFKPKVDLEFTHTRIYDKDIAPEDFYRQNKNEAYVKVTYNLYNGDKDSNALLSSYSTIRENKYKTEEERRKVKWIISNLHQSLNALESSIRSTKEEVQSSQLTVESYWETFKNGEQDLQTLLTAQRQLNSAQVSLIESYQNRLNDYFKMLFESGQLVEHFDLDPTKDTFIDFRPSHYNKKNAHTQEDIDLIALASVFKKDEKSDEIKQSDTIEDILLFKDKFLDTNDDYFTLYIGEFDTMYDTFAFIKNHKLSKQAFMVDILNDYKLKNIMAYGIYDNQDEANAVLTQLPKMDNKEYKVVSIKEIKEYYKTFIDGFDELRPKEFVETTTIKMAPKPPKPYFTNKAFKEQFIQARPDSYTINVVTFAKLDDAIQLVNKENIYDKSLIFRYGTNAEWIKVVYGVFETYDEAKAAMSQLSYDTRDKYFPVIEFIKDKQELFEKYKILELGVPETYTDKVEYETVSKKTTTQLRELKPKAKKTEKKEEVKPKKEMQKELPESVNEEVKKPLAVEATSQTKKRTLPTNAQAPTEVHFEQNNEATDDVIKEEKL